MKFKSRKKLAVDRNISLSTQKRLERHPKHPKPVQISPGRVVFVEDETDEFDRWLVAQRDAAA